jgi:hypothetical protein
MPAALELIGQRFGRLTVLQQTSSRNGRRCYVCLCDCGAERVVQANRLRRGETQSCGCVRRKYPDLVPGIRFGRLTVLRQVPSRNRQRYYACLCDCGTETNVRGADLCRGDQNIACGCLRGRHIKHGMHGTPEYRAWRGMIGRCESRTHANYGGYGGRGIKVCDRWRHSFENFFADMGLRPSPKHSLDRIDNDAPEGYTSANCRWTTQDVQIRNSRKIIPVKVDGKIVCMKDACALRDVSYVMVRDRVRRGWPIEKALATPTMRPRLIATSARWVVLMMSASAIRVSVPPILLHNVGHA